MVPTAAQLETTTSQRLCSWQVGLGMGIPGPEGGKKATPSATPLHLAWSTLGPAATGGESAQQMVRGRERCHQPAAQTQQRLCIWGALFQVSCSLPRLPPALHYSYSFWALLPFLFPAPFSSHLPISPSLTTTPFSLFSLSLCSVWQRKREGPKLEVKALMQPQC